MVFSPVNFCRIWFFHQLHPKMFSEATKFNHMIRSLDKGLYCVHWNYVSSRGSSLLRFDWLFQLPSKEFSRHQFTVLYIVTEVTISNVLRAACFRLVLECVRLARKLHRFFVMQNIMVYTTGWNWAANGNNNWSLRNAVLAADLFLATKTGCVF